jgi:hypothetical protein
VNRANRPQTVIRAPRTRVIPCLIPWWATSDRMGRNAVRGNGRPPADQAAQEKGAAAPAGTAAHETRPGGDAGLVGKALPAASADPDGRDQSLVRRTGATRHLRVRHWITSFPLLHLRRVMPSRERPVKAFPHRRRRPRSPAAGSGTASPLAGVAPGRAAGSRLSYPTRHRPNAAPLRPSTDAKRREPSRSCPNFV